MPRRSCRPSPWPTRPSRRLALGSSSPARSRTPAGSPRAAASIHAAHLPRRSA
jgi:hypothetical protein